MLNRRHIRLKVMQSIYSYNMSKNNDLARHEKSMIKNFDEVLELKFSLLALVLEIIKYATKFYEDNKKKHFPSKLDLNPNLRFTQNKFIDLILNNKLINNSLKKSSKIWISNDHDIARKLFVKIHDSDLYKKYLKHQDYTIDIDNKFFINLMNEIIFTDKLVHHIIEEKSIYWIDDLPFVATIIFSEIKNINLSNNNYVFKDKTDKYFAVKLFNDTINNSQEYNEIIIQFAKNWDIERIAIMDQILLKMAFAEILHMHDLPIKVSMNEYIEISKYYSTPKSKLFINGLLDSFVKEYKKKGKICKEGKGLIE